MHPLFRTNTSVHCMLLLLPPTNCVNVITLLCSAVLTHTVAPLSARLFHRPRRRLFSRLCSELGPLSGCRHGDTGHDPRPVLITYPLMAHWLMLTMSKGNNNSNNNNNNNNNNTGCLQLLVIDVSYVKCQKTWVFTYIQASNWKLLLIPEICFWCLVSFLAVFFVAKWYILRQKFWRSE